MKLLLSSFVAFILGAILSAYLIILGGLSPERNYTRVHVENDSQEKISKIEINYFDGSVSINNINKGENRTLILSSSTEGEYKIRAVFEDGTEVIDSNDYYTSGIGGRKRISRKGIIDVE